MMLRQIRLSVFNAKTGLILTLQPLNAINSNAHLVSIGIRSKTAVLIVLKDVMLVIQNFVPNAIMVTSCLNKIHN